GAVIQVVAVVNPVLGRVGADDPELGALLFRRALPADVYFRRPLGDDGATRPARAFDGEYVAPTAQAGELINLIGMMATGVDSAGTDGHLNPGGVPVALLKSFIKRRPGSLVSRVAHNHLVIDGPAFQALAPANHQQLQPV